MYFDKRGKGKEISYEGEECWERDYDGEGPWKPKSCFTPVEGDNEALEEFIDELFKYLFDPKNFRQVRDNLTPQERRSLKKLSRFNKDENNPRIIRVQDKGSSFVLDFKETYSQECMKYLDDENTFRQEKEDPSEKHAQVVNERADKWNEREVISIEVSDWVRVVNPKPALVYANVKTHEGSCKIICFMKALVKVEGQS